MTNQGVNFHLPSAGQFSVAVDSEHAERGGKDPLSHLSAFCDLTWIVHRLEDQSRARHLFERHVIDTGNDDLAAGSCWPPPTRLCRCSWPGW
jgi:hypothetical protein